MTNAEDQTGTDTEGLDIATFGGGCFWCLEPAFDDLRGVISVESGYAGGHVPRPTYEQVCSGRTGHAEVVQITYDPRQISYDDLLHVFFTIHDPTTLNRQGADVGTQYRSIILFHNPEQKASAEKSIRDLQQEGIWGAPIVTELVPFETFYRAEDYHQEYFANNPSGGYCSIVIAPKIAKFRKQYASMLKKQYA